MTYTISTTVEAPFEEVLDAANRELSEEGFGVLADIDVQETFASKLDEEIERYRILGACNPPLAHEGISIESDLGALLPCNVIVYESETGEVVLSAVDPEELIGVTGNEDLRHIASEIEERLSRAVNSVAAEFGTGAGDQELD
ncbi:MAG: DUF302 domain-containing protein [Halodesulfurarchaeum sp.]